MARTYNLDADFLNRYLEIDKTINSDVVFEHYPRSSKKNSSWLLSMAEYLYIIRQ